MYVFNEMNRDKKVECKIPFTYQTVYYFLIRNTVHVPMFCFSKEVDTVKSGWPL